MSDAGEIRFNREEIEAIHEKFREVKHSVANTLAVIMAFSELSQRNPANYEKLAAAVLQRGPGVIEQLQDFQALLTAKLVASKASGESGAAGA